MTAPRRHTLGSIAAAPALRPLLFTVGLWALLMAATTAPALALASEASNQREGQRLLRSIEEGSNECSDLSNGDFELIGEYVMGRMAGSIAAHEQMDELMRTMIGPGSEEQMHVFMGRRFTDCGGSRIPGGFGGMMGVMGMMGGAQTGADGNGFGAMMGSVGVEDNNDGWSGAAIVMTVLMGVLLALAAAALFAWRPWRGSPRRPAALEVLDQRYARGELDAEDYERRRQALWSE